MARTKELLLIMITIAYINCAVALMLPQYARRTGGEYDDFDEEEGPAAAITPTPNHITRIVHPSEIRVPQSLEEFTKVVGAEMAAALMNQATPTAATDGIGGSDTDVDANTGQRQEKTITYTQLSELLAMWQLEKERNAYEMQTNRQHEFDLFPGRTY